MTIWQAIILGIIQGATEFLPVSSSGHLVLAGHWLGLTDDSVVFEVAVHVGTLMAVLVYFRSRIATVIRSGLSDRNDTGEGAQSRKYIAYVILATIPAGVVGLLFKSEIESAFGAPLLAAIFLIVTGLWLLAMRLRREPTKSLGPTRAWWIGCAQAVAILPGISRSGVTIATGALLGIPAAVAAEFSFLLSIPAVAGAAILSLPDAIAAGHFHLADVVGAVAAAITGYVALALVFAAIRRGRFIWFGIYCLVVGVVTVVVLN